MTLARDTIYRGNEIMKAARRAVATGACLFFEPSAFENGGNDPKQKRVEQNGRQDVQDGICSLRFDDFARQQHRGQRDCEETSGKKQDHCHDEENDAVRRHLSEWSAEARKHPSNLKSKKDENGSVFDGHESHLMTSIAEGFS
jgi:hypothetical protein